MKTLAAPAAVLAILLVQANPLWAQQKKKVYVAPDDHTDYMWSANEAAYRSYFSEMLDYYVLQADNTILTEPAMHQSRFSTDGCFWLWEYERNRTPAQFQKVIDRIKSGHLSSPLNALACVQGGKPAEAVLRSMYYPGRLERRYPGVKFLIAHTVENATLPYGIGALWQGSGAKYSWQGVCNCPSLVPGLSSRQKEIYRWGNPDGTSLIIKWFSLPGNNQSLGGYAEARSPGAAIDLVTTNAGSNGFAARYPYSVIGVFGQGWDDLSTKNLNLQAACKSKTDATRDCIVSNEEDFFKDFEAVHGASLPTLSMSYGNEWDLAVVSLQEVSARVKRSVEKLRSAEAMATLVNLKDSGFMNGRQAARDLAFMNLGLYFEHDFEDGGPGVTGAARIAWQRRIADEIKSYVDTLQADAARTLGEMIQKPAAATHVRFYAFNPLSWTRTDIADFPYAGAWPVHVVDLETGLETPSQIVTLEGVKHVRIQARSIPSLGYKVFEIRSGAGQTFSNPLTADAATGVMENAAFRITVSGRGAITSLIDKTRGNREFAATLGGYALNDLGGDTFGGARSIENAGPVSVTLVATGTTNPLTHDTRITLFRDSDRIEIRNEVKQNFGGTRSWRYSYNLTNPDVRHEEVGAVIRARRTTDGGHYSPANARTDYLTLNHFADTGGDGPVGVVLSNADAYFMRVGNSTVTTIDTATAQISPLLGGELRPARPIRNQAGDAYFLQRFALRTRGAYDATAAMKFALEHQNPLVTATVTGATGAYPEKSFSYLTVSDPNVLLWALKPAEEGIGQGVIARVWNQSASPVSFTLTAAGGLSGAKKATHIETDIASLTPVSGALSASIAQHQILTFRLFPSSQPPVLPQVTLTGTDLSAAEAGINPGTVTVARTGSTTSGLTVNYSIGGTAGNGADYQTLSGSVTIPAGAASAVVTVTPIDDGAVEGNETVVLTLSANAAYNVGSPSSATVTIADNDSALPSVTLTAPDAAASESGDPGSFTVIRTGSTAQALVVNYGLGGSAAGGADYQTLPGSVTIPAGAASAALSVTPIDDGQIEGSEMVVLTLSTGAGYTIGSPSSATVTIADNDGSSGAFLQDGGTQGIVSLEAEGRQEFVDQGGHTWTAVTAPAGYSGNGAFRAMPNVELNVDTGYVTGSPRLDFYVNFVKTGTHYVWVRGAAENGNDDSVHVGLDGAAVASADRIHGFLTGWGWSKATRDGPVATLTVTTTGIHTVNVWMREDGFYFDKLVLTTDGAYTPSGAGPAQSPQPGCGCGGLVSITSVSTGKPYALGTAQPGAVQYIDRGYTITSLGAGMNGGVLVRTANDDKFVTTTPHLVLAVSQPATVYVVMDAIMLPPWLSDGTWSASAQTIVTTDSSAYKVYQKSVAAGPVSLGGNNQGGATGTQAHYLVIVKASGTTSFSPAGPETMEWEHVGDTDGDGLTDLFESSMGLDLLNLDSDGDGTPDERERAPSGESLWELQEANAAPTGSGGGDSGGACGALGAELFILLGIACPLSRSRKPKSN